MIISFYIHYSALWVTPEDKSIYILLSSLNVHRLKTTQKTKQKPSLAIIIHVKRVWNLDTVVKDKGRFKSILLAGYDHVVRAI